MLSPGSETQIEGSIINDACRHQCANLPSSSSSLCPDSLSRTDTGWSPAPVPPVSAEIAPSALLAPFTLVSTSGFSSFPYFPGTQSFGPLGSLASDSWHLALLCVLNQNW